MTVQLAAAAAAAAAVGAASAHTWVCCRCCQQGLQLGTSTTACGSHLDHVVCWHLGLLIRAVAVVWRECCVEWSGVDVGVIWSDVLEGSAAASFLAIMHSGLVTLCMCGSQNDTPCTSRVAVCAIIRLQKESLLPVALGLYRSVTITRPATPLSG
jgi:hypothetical protein